MKKVYDTVYQFRINLEDISPVIWRKIQVPGTYTFWDFHIAIADAMGWGDCHLHEFEYKEPKFHKIIPIGRPSDIDPDRVVLLETRTKIARFFDKQGDKVLYIYDFGDYWCHKVVLDKILPRDYAITYPRCIAGRRACPLEDIGGTSGYENFLASLSDPQDPDYARSLGIAGDSFDPDDFEYSQVVFRDPGRKHRLKTIMQ